MSFNLSFAFLDKPIMCILVLVVRGLVANCFYIIQKRRDNVGRTCPLLIQDFHMGTCQGLG